MFTVAGTSILNGVMKARFANDMVSRVKVLERNKHEGVRLITLPESMSKDAAIAFLAQHEDFQDAEAQAVFADWTTKRAPKEPKRPRKAAETATEAPAEAATETAPVASKRKGKKAKTEQTEVAA